LLSLLSVLKDSELLYERGIYPKSTYIFRHALTREVVYDSILAARKKKLHVDIGDAIEKIYKDNLDENYEVLAEHYITGENYQKGAEYCRMAARKTEGAGSLTDSISYGKERVACLEKLPPTEEVDKKIIDARTSLGLYYLQLSYNVEANQVVEPVVELALARNYSRRVSQIYTIIGAYRHTVEEDYPTAFKYLGEALQLAEELNDSLSLFFSSFRLGWALGDNCQFEKGLYHLERALEINVAAILPAPPGLLIHTMSTPRIFFACSAIILAPKSVPPPGANPIVISIGLVGKAVSAAIAFEVKEINPNAKNNIFSIFIVVPPFSK